MNTLINHESFFLSTEEMQIPSQNPELNNQLIISEQELKTKLINLKQEIDQTKKNLNHCEKSLKNKLKMLKDPSCQKNKANLEKSIFNLTNTNIIMLKQKLESQLKKIDLMNMQYEVYFKKDKHDLYPLLFLNYEKEKNNQKNHLKLKNKETNSDFKTAINLLLGLTPLKNQINFIFYLPISKENNKKFLPVFEKTLDLKTPLKIAAFGQAEKHQEAINVQNLKTITIIYKAYIEETDSRDIDNIVINAKPLVDGIFLGLKIDDSYNKGLLAATYIASKNAVEPHLSITLLLND